jgi:hypothetical protein
VVGTQHGTDGVGGLAVGMIAFSIIDKSIVDVLATSYYEKDSQLKFAISALLIAAPIFYVISNLINKGLKTGELDRESGIRRWLTYFILLVSSISAEETTNVNSLFCMALLILSCNFVKYS